jgi:hypothetical protein
MTQQVLDRDRPIERLQRQHDLAIVAPFLDADLHVGEGPNVFRDGIGERELAVLDEHHGRDAGDGLRHRIETEYGVRAHRKLGRDIADAEILEIDRLAMLLDQQDCARDFAGRDLVSDVIRNLRQPFG